ncbi:MAG: bifunctional riboflavin kinase/FAD synthetase [Armatimonadota bacterium]|nr:bifunctional riboflavin kinase/FAD synthetase [bacterium]
MSVTFGLENIPHEARGCAVAIGVFDGVHWGHRAIFDELVGVATSRGIKSAALTFDKHPTELLAPSRAPEYISTLEQRIELIQAAGVDEVIVAEFNQELASLSREDFMSIVLRGFLRARHIVVGSNFRFGRDREGDTRYLMSNAPLLGIGVNVVPAVIVAGGPVSSTRVRALLSKGDIIEANKLLGRRFALRGTVVRGEQIGRTIGYPTANIQPGTRQIIPARGVYVVESKIDHTSYTGVCNIGRRPTFGGHAQTIEVHFSGFQGDIYGHTLDVTFLRRLRDEMTFESPDMLADQIRKDLERAVETQ